MYLNIMVQDVGVPPAPLNHFSKYITRKEKKIPHISMMQTDNVLVAMPFKRVGVA